MQMRVLTQEQLETSRPIRRVIWHWTGGTHIPNAIDLRAYNFLFGQGIQGACIYPGKFGLEAQIPKMVGSRLKLLSGSYAAHTRNLNSYSAGLSIASMHGATRTALGDYPPMEEQMNLMLKATADIVEFHDIEINERNVLNHSEVEPVLDIKQRNKWDIDVLPWIEGDKYAVHAWMREQLMKMVNNDSWEIIKPTTGIIIQGFGGYQGRVGINDNSTIYIPVHVLLEQTPVKHWQFGQWSLFFGWGRAVYDLEIETYNGEPHVSVRVFAKKFGLRLDWDNTVKQVVLKV